MKTLLLILVSFLFSISSIPKEKEVNQWLVSSQSTVSIEGNTNINSFECQSMNYHGNDILEEEIIPGDKTATWSGEVTLRSQNFDCFNRMMTKDFHKTVKAEEHPEIQVRFLDLKRENLNTAMEKLSGNVEITLAGTCRRFPISCQLSTKENGKTFLLGAQEVTFSDFQLDPPIKFLGTVKVENSIKVKFELVLEKI
ncbi:hypothetical protein OU792_06130 [Algoriphagus sp. NF]|uniref:YceI family protein n=1 Tax=Algoriphagus sp. NF TaxID=2992756 RepID=UPI00237B3B56|nr:YceI family protein [Algoriphagus sp. NF]MDE0559557.1 hypothetical protein [Algoriphagus sp. NF]